MPKSLRVRLEPKPTPSSGETRAVAGVSVSLTRRGQGRSLGKLGSSMPAAIQFTAALLESARAPERRELRPLARIAGTLTLAADSAAPLLTITDFGELTRTSEQPHRGSTPRQLRVELAGPTFARLNDAALVLTLPDMTGFRHLELEATLEIAGADEAASALNDTLDVPLVPRQTFAIQLVDELGEPVSDAELAFQLEGLEQRVLTDERGAARADSLGSNTAVVRLVHPGAVRAVLSERWNSARPGVYLRAGAGVLVRRHDELAEPIALVGFSPQIVSVQPAVREARVRGLLFETNKSFLVPEAIPGMRALRQMSDASPGAKLLIVGHTDATAEPAVNDPLSLERAESVSAFLRDDVAVWLARYDSGPQSRRWGSAEDSSMLRALTLSASPSEAVDELRVRTFQRMHNELPEELRSRHFAPLPESGTLDAETRRQLIADYMNPDGTTLAEDIEVTVHGCGENFPLDPSGTRLEATSASPPRRDALDRRVELFFFDAELGIQPPVPGKNSGPKAKEYPEWRRRAQETLELEVSARGALDITTFAPPTVEPELIITDERGARVATLSRVHGVQEEDSLRFSLLPEVLPSRIELAVLRDGRVDRESSVFDPVALRDALFFGDLDSAQDGLAGTPGPPSATPAAFVQTAARRRAAAPSRAPATQQALRVLVSWENPRHRFLRNALPELTPLDGRASNTTLPLASGSAPGRASFDIPEGTTRFDLKLKIASRLVTLVDLQQTYRVLRPTKSRPSILPERSNSSAQQHPRIHSAAYTAGPPGTTVIELVLDLLFLDVTDHVLALPTKANLRFGERLGRFSEVVNNKAALDIQSAIRILEFTGGQPTTWPVILPPKLPQQLEHGVLLFLKNEALSSVDAQGVVVPGKRHVNSDDLQYSQALLPWWGSPSRPGHYVDTDFRGNLSYFPYPPFGWDAKLRDSGKTPIVLFPVPHGANKGVLEQPTRKSRTLLTRALACLFADGHIGTGGSFPPFIRHLVVAGWSSGTDTLFKWVPVATPKTSDLVE